MTNDNVVATGKSISRKPRDNAGRFRHGWSVYVLDECRRLDVATLFIQRARLVTHTAAPWYMRLASLIPFLVVLLCSTMAASFYTDAVLLLGDSITQAWSEGSFAQRLSEYYLRRLDILNRGYGGKQPGRMGSLELTRQATTANGEVEAPPLADR